MKIALTIPGGTKINPAIGMPEGGINVVRTIIQWGITVLFVTATVLALIFLIWGGIQWITSSGDKAKIEGARKRIIFSIIGLVLVFLSFMIINIIGDFFKVDLLKFWF